MKNSFRDTWKTRKKSGYNFLSARENNQLLGFACWGPTSLSKATIDLYWICSSVQSQGRGVASQLLTRVEENARAIGRWNAVIWTSSRPDYLPARNFYLKMGYTLALQYPEFYDYNDDLCVFMKRL